MRARELSWDGCVNVRDLGGHPTEDGRETRYGAIVRADSVRQLSDAGWESLLGHGVSAIVDLRVHSELAADPPRELAVDVVHVPVVAELDSPHWVEIHEIGDRAPDYRTATRDVYVEFLERFRENFARAVAEVARAPAGSVVVHCAGGKDRTGLVVALLLRVVGVPVAEIAGDYAISEENLREETTQWIAAAEDDLERGRRSRIAVAPAQSMVDVLTEIDRRYGSVEDYLRAGGLPDADLERIRARLLA